jgi:hypothetical protein
MASIDLTQVRSVVASAYRVANTITNPSGMPAEVFVFRTNDQSFSRVASPTDLSLLPSSLESAQTSNNEFYRSAVASRDFALLDEAQDFAAMIRNRLPVLVKEYNALVTLFVGTTTTTVTS